MKLKSGLAFIIAAIAFGAQARDMNMLRGKSFDITGKRRNLTGIRGITGFTLFGYLIPVKEKLSRSAKLLILLLKSLHWSKGGVQNQFYHTSK